MDASALPPPADLRRRYEALIAVEDLLGPGEDGYRAYGTEPPDVWWFEDGGGNDHRLVVVGGDALLTAFDHEAPRSPWAHDDDVVEWPGLLEGLPDHLRARLPEREEDEPLSVSACWWFVDGAWQAGRPEPVPPEDEEWEDEYTDDPGGGAKLLRPLVQFDEGVRELVEDLYEAPERLDEALALARTVTGGR